MKQLVLFGLVGSFALLANASTAAAACGTFEVAKGDVKVESKGKSTPAAVGSKICSGDAVIAAEGARAKIKMEDGNELNVSPGSKIVLENYQYNPADNKKKVLLNVLKGKVRATTREENMYNDKAKDGQANTFQVKTKAAVAGVRGTDFLTSYNPSSNRAEIVTFKGKVEVGQAGPGGSIMNSVQVTAGMKTEAMSGQPPAPPKPIPAGELQRMNSDSKNDSASNRDASQNSNADVKADEKKEPDQANNSDKQPQSDDRNKGQQGDERKNPNGQQQGDNANRGGGDSSGGSVAAGGPAAGSPGSPPMESSDKGPANPLRPKMGDPNRRPASAPPIMGGSGMLNPGELTGDTTFMGPPPVMPNLPGIPLIPMVPNLPVLPVCEFCNTAVQNGPSKLNIQIRIKQ